MRRITLMVRVDDTARADVALTPERTYYRFATDSSIEDGELAAVDEFEQVAAGIVDAYMPREGETPLPHEVKLQLFVDNRLSPEPPTEESLRRVIRLMLPLSPEFAFLEGFV